MTAQFDAHVRTHRVNDVQHLKISGFANKIEDGFLAHDYTGCDEHFNSLLKISFFVVYLYLTRSDGRAFT